jgi:enamine deaminase RidA (YjgF/YER057c/UK114 family)
MVRCLVILLLLPISALAQTKKEKPVTKAATVKAATVRVRHINPPELWQNPRFTQMVEIGPGGRMILISGQVAFDKTGNLIGKGDIRAQTKQVFENLKIALDAVGATFNDVVKISAYVVDIPTNFSGYSEVRWQYLEKNDHPPASTTVGVAGLVSPDLLLEVDATVIVPDKSN